MTDSSDAVGFRTSGSEDIALNDAGNHQSSPSQDSYRGHTIPEDENVDNGDLEYLTQDDHINRVLVFNNYKFEPLWKEKEGRDIEEMMYTMFSGIDFNQIETDRLENLTEEQMINKLERDMKDEDLPLWGCYCLVFFSYGGEGYIYDKNGKPVEISKLLDILKKNKDLAGKPKLIIIQASKPEPKDGDDAVPMDEEKPEIIEEEGTPKIIPREADFLIFSSILPDRFQFFKTLKEVFEKNKGKLDVLPLLTKVQRKMADILATQRLDCNEKEYNEKQHIPLITSMFTKKLIFGS